VARAQGDERLAALAASALTDLAAPSRLRRWYLGSATSVSRSGTTNNVALVEQLSLPANVSADSP